MKIPAVVKQKKLLTAQKEKIIYNVQPLERRAPLEKLFKNTVQTICVDPWTKD